VNILMYHSIADAAGPTSIGPATFRDQLAILASSGRPVVPVEALVEALDGGPPLPDDAVVLTFDDGFLDFAEQAAPLLREHGFPAVVYLPAARIGGQEDWASPHGGEPRRLMSWDHVRGLAAEGVSFGGHSLTHPDLTTLDDETLEREVAGSADRIAEELGQRPTTFAPPYGATDSRVRTVVATHFRLALGTRFDRATSHDDRYDLPRIEMHYFRDSRRWRDHLTGRGEWYLALRKGLRAVRRVFRA
jgi:peptidoglycan/xylan/chitin deacetylase (PgdA/CDA1 family)